MAFQHLTTGQLAYLPEALMGGHEEGLPSHSCCREKDEKWGQLFHAHILVTGLPIPALTGLAQLISLALIT